MVMLPLQQNVPFQVIPLRYSRPAYGKMDEVQTIYEKLQDKHCEKYSPEQLRAPLGHLPCTSGEGRLCGGLCVSLDFINGRP